LSQPAEFDALALDFAGVMTSPLYEAMGKFSAESGIDLQDVLRACLGAYAGLDDPLVVDFETGRIAEPDFVTALAQRLYALSGKEVAPDGLVKRLFPVRLEEDMFAAVAAARSAGLRTGLVSNSWGSAMYPRARLQSAFDAVVISGEVGFRKPDPAIFRVALDLLGVTAERCIFVDDEPAHLTAAAALGMVTVLHHRSETTIAELERLLGVTLSGS
jgi:epoxide hydrolase-like predicted phosphatase